MMDPESGTGGVQPSFHRCFTGHTGAITSLHCRPSLNSAFEFLSGSTDSSLILWKYRPHLSAYRLVGHTQPVTAVRWQPGAARIASSSRDGTIRIWDADPVRRLRPQSAMQRRAWGSASASASPSSSFSNRCHVTHLRTAVNSVDWDHRGDWLIASCADDIIRVFRCRTEGAKAEEAQQEEQREPTVRVQQTGSLFGHIAAVTSAVFTPDSLLVCSGSEDGTVRVWDFDRLRSLHRYSQYTASVRSLSLHPHGNALATLSDSAVSLLDIRSHQLLQQYSVAADSPSAPTAAFTSSTSALSFSPDGRHLYVCGPLGVSVMDLRVGRLQWRVQGHEGPVTAVDVTDDGSSFVTGGVDQRLCSWTFTDSAEQLSRPASRQQRRPLQQPASSQFGGGFVAPNLPRPSRRDVVYQHRAATDKSSSRMRQPPAPPRAPDIARSQSYDPAGKGRAAAAGSAGSDDGCGYRHRHIRQDGTVWQYEPPQPPPPPTQRSQPLKQQQQQPPPEPASVFAPLYSSSAPAASAPLLHHNHSRVYRSSHLHAMPVDDLVQRLPEQLTGALQSIQRQLSAFTATLRRMETRMAVSKKRMDQVNDSMTATLASARTAAEERREEQEDEDEQDDDDDESDSKYRYD